MKQKQLPVWVPQTTPKVNTDMKADSPFLITFTMPRSDLGQCVIGIDAPHYVAKVRAFRTVPRDEKERSVAIADRQEEARRQYFGQRETAEFKGQLADRLGMTVPQLIADAPADVADTLPQIYDEEFDEPRVIAKVPGLNVYLEFFGCLDDIDPDDIDWDGDSGVFATLTEMAGWYPSTLTNADRQTRATQEGDTQLLDQWEADVYDPAATQLPRKRGIGVWPYVDPSRRPELLHVKVPKVRGIDAAAVRSIKAIKVRRAEAAGKSEK